MNTRVLSTRFFVLGALVFSLAAFAAQAQAQDVLASLLQQTGLKYKTLNGSWMVPFNDGKGKTINEYVTYSNNRREFALIFVTIVHRPPHYVFSRALLTEAMKMNNDDVGAKFVLDDDRGDIDCQTEVYLPTATPASLKMALDNVASRAIHNMEKLNSL
ncbi:MAG TPA: hypothetical protein VNH42_03690 [Mariprofundaceae bacterium]|nr:hypothetical protein [Mariprofundaceae bacterium]